LREAGFRWITRCRTGAYSKVKKFGKGDSDELSLMNNRCRKSGNRKNATGIAKICKRMEAVSRSIG